MSGYLGKTSFKHIWAGIKSRLANKVDVTRTINGKPLTSDITLTASDLGVDSGSIAASVLSEAKSYTDVEVAEALSEAKAYTDANAGSGGGTTPAVDNSNHQFSISGTNLETGWYKIGTTSGGFKCIVNIIDIVTVPDDTVLEMQASVLISSTEGDSLDEWQLLSGAFFVNGDNHSVDHLSFERIGCTYNDDDTIDWHMYYNNPGYIAQNCAVTVTNLSSGEMNVEYDGEVFPMKLGLVSQDHTFGDPGVDSPYSSFACNECELDIRDAMLATTTDVAAVRSEVKTYTDTEVAGALAEAKAYTDANASSGTDKDVILAELKAYVDTEVAKALEEAKNYTDTAIGTVVEAVEEHNAAMLERINLLEENIASTTGVLPVEGVEF